MKINSILLIPILLISCARNSRHSAKLSDKPWEMWIRTTQQNTYMQSGLLDSTYRDEEYYIHGEPGSTVKLILTRKYDSKNNLILEKTYEVLKKGVDFFEMKRFTYDKRNNLIYQTDQLENEIREIIQLTYNDHNQKTGETDIYRKFDSIPRNWTVDSMELHHNDRHIVQYDTIFSKFKYDEKGNQVNQFYTNSFGEITGGRTTIFSGTDKIKSFRVDSKGDTGTIINYGKQGDFITEIQYKKHNPSYTDTTWYAGNKIIQSVKVDNENKFRDKQTYKYDEKGNEVENVSYR